jgi:hypothetical protein
VTGRFRAVNTVYEASPACLERECVIFYCDDRSNLKGIYQHGENPEAVLLIDLIYFGTEDEAAAAVREKFRVFAERCHRHEDGILEAAPA